MKNFETMKDLISDNLMTEIIIFKDVIQDINNNTLFDISP